MEGKKLGLSIALAIVLLAGCAPMEGRETAGEYVDDATISTKVRAELVKDQTLKAFDIHVDTMQDVVQLSGFVGTEQQKEQAGRIAAGISGVRGVHNNIIVHGS
jgi:hyperosmotically inducible periplasmic protein